MIGRILLPVSPQEPSERIASYAIEVASAFDASIVVLSVLDAPQQRDQLRNDPSEQARDSVSPIRDRAQVSGIEIDHEIREGMAAEAILDASSDFAVDLIVMATHARTGIDRMILGSVAESVLRESTVPVLTVPPGSGHASTE